MDGPRKNLYAGNPAFLNLRLASIGGGQLTNLDSAMGQSLGKRHRFVVASSQGRLRGSVQSDPQILVTLAHIDLSSNSIA
jgi:hypothetical protein